MMISTGTPAPIFAPKSLLEKVESIDLSGVLSHALPEVGGKDAVKPSMFRLDTATAQRAVGGRVTGQSFVRGLAYLLTRHAWGDSFEALGKGLPRAVQASLQQGCGTLKQGAGLDLDRLVKALGVAMNTLCALPVRKVTPAITAPAVAATAGAVMAGAVMAVVIDDTSDKREPIAHDLSAGERTEAEAAPARLAQQAIDRAAAQAAANAEERTAALAQVKAGRLAELEVQASTREAEVIVLCRLADKFGIKLTKAQLALLDKVAA